MKRIVLTLILVLTLVGLCPSTLLSQVSIDNNDTVGDTVKDPDTKDVLEKEGIDPTSTILERDYGEKVDDGVLGVDNALACSREYYDSKTGSTIVIIGALPYVDASNDSILPRWEDNNFYYLAEENTFICVVQDDVVVIVAENDQGSGIENSDTLGFRPQLFLGKLEILPISVKGSLLEDDPLGNPNYTENTIVWDYGICKRYLRLIEGKILGYWEFTEVPKGDIRIIYNQSGPFRLDLGGYAIDDDTELITVADFTGLFRFEEVVYISDTMTFYPDASPESTSVDGYAGRVGGQVWSSLHDGNGTISADALTNQTSWMIQWAFSNWNLMRRSIYLFDTSALPDDATITSATMSLYGTGKVNTLGASPVINIFESNPTSNTAVVNGDYQRSEPFDTVLCSSPITYAGWSTSGWNDFALNAAGLALISKTSVTKFGAREGNYDAPDSEPPHGGMYSYATMINYTSEQGTGFKPKLVVVYTTGGVVGLPGRSNSIYSPSSPGGMFF